MTNVEQFELLLVKYLKNNFNEGIQSIHEGVMSMFINDYIGKEDTFFPSESKSGHGIKNYLCRMVIKYTFDYFDRLGVNYFHWYFDKSKI